MNKKVDFPTSLRGRRVAVVVVVIIIINIEYEECIEFE